MATRSMTCVCVQFPRTLSYDTLRGNPTAMTDVARWSLLKQRILETIVFHRPFAYWNMWKSICSACKIISLISADTKIGSGNRLSKAFQFSPAAERPPRAALLLSRILLRIFVHGMGCFMKNLLFCSVQLGLLYFPSQRQDIIWDSTRYDYIVSWACRYTGSTYEHSLGHNQVY